MNSKEKIAVYYKVSKQFMAQSDAMDFIQGTLTARMDAFVLAASKEQGEITVFVPRPSFLDWLFRRTRTVVQPYTIRQLMKAEYITDTIPTIEFGEQYDPNKHNPLLDIPDEY